MQPQENKFITLLTPREQRAVDNINAVLNGDGSDPESGPGAWGDCGEVDVPVVLEALARLSLVPATDEVLARIQEELAGYHESELLITGRVPSGAPESYVFTYTRDVTALLARMKGKTAPEIRADIERLEAQKNRNKLGREALLKAMQEQPGRREEFEAEYAAMKRRYEDYDVRIQALDWVLAGA